MGICLAKGLGGACSTKVGDLIIQPGLGVLMGACSAKWLGGQGGRGEVSDKDEREIAVEPVEQTIMCPGHEHLLPNAAV